jgi:hypothetical protein
VSDLEKFLVKQSLTLVVAAVFALMIAHRADASILNVSENTATVPTVTSNPNPVTSTGTILNVTGDVANQYRSPFETPSGAPINPQFGSAVYTAIEGGASGVWNFAPSNLLSLFWGSPDAWNHIQFWSGLGGTGTNLGSISGNQLAAYLTSPDMGHDFVSVLLSSLFQSITLSSDLNAFEFTNLTAMNQVPLPTPLALFATGVLGMVLLSRRKKRNRAAG